MASICNDDCASLGLMSGHERKTLRLSVRVSTERLPVGLVQAERDDRPFCQSARVCCQALKRASPLATPPALTAAN